MFCLKSVYEGLNHCLLVLLFSSTFIYCVNIIVEGDDLDSCTPNLEQSEENEKQILSTVIEEPLP